MVEISKEKYYKIVRLIFNRSCRFSGLKLSGAELKSAISSFSDKNFIYLGKSGLKPLSELLIDYGENSSIHLPEVGKKGSQEEYIHFCESIYSILRFSLYRGTQPDDCDERKLLNICKLLWLAGLRHKPSARKIFMQLDFYEKLFILYYFLYPASLSQ